MTNDKSNKELDKSTLRIPTFNMILRQILVVNAYEEFYLYERPWSMILGTPVKAWDNRLPFMMLPQHPNAYYAAMCLYNMVNNNTEMKKHKIPKITYGKESC